MYHNGAYGAHQHFLGLGGFILGILFWVLFIWLIIALIRWITAGHEDRQNYWSGHAHCDCKKSGPETKDKPAKETPLPAVPAIKSDPEYLKILKERYAKGEINKEEFEQKKKDLM